MTRNIIVAAIVATVVIIALFFFLQPEPGNQEEGMPPHATGEE